MNAPAQNAAPVPFGGLNIPEGLVWKYEVVIRAGRPEHIWALIDHERGAVHVHASLSEFGGEYSWIGGIEMHYSSAPDYMNAEKPHHERCWVIGKPCWHDGTSLGFSERVADLLPAPYEPWKAHAMGPYEHQGVTGVMLSYYRTNILGAA